MMDTISIRYGDNFLELPPGAALKFTLNNPLFSDSVADGELSFPFTVDARGKNQIHFFFNNLLTKREGLLTNVEVFIYVGSQRLYKSRMDIISANDDVYEIVVRVGSSLLTFLKTTNLKDIDYGGNRLIGASRQIWHFKVPSGFTTGDLHLRIRQDAQHYNSAVDIDVPFNTSIAQTVIDFVDALNFTAITFEGFYGYVDKVFQFTAAVDSSNSDEFTIIRDDIGFYPETDIYQYYYGPSHVNLIIIEQPDYNLIRDTNWDIEFNTYKDTDFTESSHCYFPVLVKNHQILPCVDATQIMQNNYDPATDRFLLYPYGPRTGSLSSKIQTAPTPFPFVGYVLQQLFKHVGLNADLSAISSNELARLCIWNNFIADHARTVRSIATGFFYYDYDQQINLANHVPDMLCDEFLKKIQSTFGFKVIIKQNNNCELVILRNLFVSRTVKDWSTKTTGKHRSADAMVDGFSFAHVLAENSAFKVEPVPPGAFLGVDPDFMTIPFSDGDYYYRTDTAQPGYWITKNILWGGDEFYANVLEPYVINGGETEIEGAGILSSIDRFTVGAYDLKLPIYDGALKGFTTEYNDASKDLQLLFSRGFQPVFGGSADYPLAGADTKYVAGGAITGATHSLYWEGEDGLYNQFWKEYCVFWQNKKTVDMWLDITLTDLLTLDFKHQYFINGKYYFIKAIYPELPIRKSTRVEFYSIEQ